MAARDLYYNAVRNALVKDNWKITHDPLTLVFGLTDVQVDLGAERIIAAERGTEKIAVEVKSFVGKSIVEDFKNALGSYTLYASLLEDKEPDRRLFLAVPFSVFENAAVEAAIQRILQKQSIGTISFNPSKEEIVEWKI